MDWNKFKNYFRIPYPRLCECYIEALSIFNVNCLHGNYASQQHLEINSYSLSSLHESTQSCAAEHCLLIGRDSCCLRGSINSKWTTENLETSCHMQFLCTSHTTRYLYMYQWVSNQGTRRCAMLSINKLCYWLLSKWLCGLLVNCEVH